MIVLGLIAMAWGAVMMLGSFPKIAMGGGTRDDGNVLAGGVLLILVGVALVWGL